MTAKLTELLSRIGQGPEPGRSELRVGVTSILFVIAQDDRQQALDQTRELKARFTAGTAEWNRATFKTELANLQSFLSTTYTAGTTPPSLILGATVTTSVTALVPHQETYPSRFRHWTAARLGGMYVLSCQGRIDQVRSELSQLLTGVGISSAIQGWQAQVQAAWASNPSPPPAGQPDPVVQALQAYPATEPVSDGSPFGHWLKVHLPAMVTDIQAGNRARAETDWNEAWQGTREF
ncbi:MAG: hypothetical protein HY815_18500 [Candidatus Riflebacteria bacterium]|nr:hypothetical protein [Candidatus Riflebacteria bacterium]